MLLRLSVDIERRQTGGVWHIHRLMDSTGISSDNNRDGPGFKN